MQTILQTEDLTKVYKIGKVEVPALRGVSLQIEKGEFVNDFVLGLVYPHLYTVLSRLSIRFSCSKTR